MATAEDKPDPEAEGQGLPPQNPGNEMNDVQEVRMDPEATDRAPVVALVILLIGFSLLLAFLLWDSLVQVVRWFTG